MKKLVPLLLALATGCGPPAVPENGQTVAIEGNLLAGLQSDTAAQDQARIKALIDRAMPAAIPDAATARYRNLRAGVGGAACGEVAAAAANAPFRHFVITPNAVAVVGDAPGIKFNDPSDFLADAWVRWCATPDELKLVEAELRRPLPSSGNDFIPAPQTTMPVLKPEPAAAEPPPDTKIDSFAASVRRPQ
jgi:hypothetical protein